jgi:hydroxymethylpyrimidine/phosphomethylpyrimidine kinase
LAAAVTANLALGEALETAVARAIAYVQAAMAAGHLPRAGELVLLGHAAAAETVSA